MKAILTSREYEVQGTWYAPKNFLARFKSVVSVEIINMSSSAGDWDGLIFQQIKNFVYVIPFSQENRFPKSGFNLHTGNVKYKLREDLFKKDDVIERYCFNYGN